MLRKRAGAEWTRIAVLVMGVMAFFLGQFNETGKKKKDIRLIEKSSKGLCGFAPP